MADANMLEMSDEDIIKMVDSDLPTDVEEDDSVEQEVAPVEQEEAEEAEESDNTEEEETEEDADEPEEEDTAEDESESDETDSEESEEDSKEEDNTSEASQQLKELYAPFKANGKEMAVDNIADARQLMQMGANYNKKMQGLKPNLKLLKMLENNSLLDEGKLSYLIDLSNKDPDAIAKLLKESGLDPLDIDVEKGSSEYKPKTSPVSDAQVELDNVLEDLQSTPTYHETLDIVSNKWDNSSKQVLVKNPKFITLINSQVADGTYKQISTIMDKERALGRLEGLSDIEAYKQIGDALYERGELVSQRGAPRAEAGKPLVIKGASKVRDEQKLKNQKRSAAATNKPAAAKAVPKDFNPLALSDEEFEKTVSSKFL